MKKKKSSERQQKMSPKDIDKMLSADIDRIFEEVFGVKAKGKRKK